MLEVSQTMACTDVTSTVCETLLCMSYVVAWDDDCCIWTVQQQKRIGHQFGSYLYQAGWCLRQKPVGGSKTGGLPHPSLSPFPPLPLSNPFPLRFQTNHGMEGQIQ